MKPWPIILMTVFWGCLSLSGCADYSELRDQYAPIERVGPSVDSNMLPTATARFPISYGIYFSNGNELVELSKFMGKPTDSQIKETVMIMDPRENILMYLPDYQFEYFSLLEISSGNSLPVDYFLRDDGGVAVRIIGEVSDGSYCFTSESATSNPMTIPYWCFRTGEVNNYSCEDEIGCVTYENGEPIRLAAALVISGPNSSLGRDSQYGVEIAIDFQGEVAGHHIQLLTEDAGCNAEGGQAAGYKIGSDPTILGVIGTSCSGAAVPMSRIISDAGYFMVSPSNTAPSLTDPDQAWNPGYLRTAHNDKVQGIAIAEYAFNVLGIKTAATIHDGDPYTESLTASFRTTFEQLGGTVIANSSVQRNADTQAVLSAIAAEGPPQLIYFPVFTTECINLARQGDVTPGLENTVFAASDGCISKFASDGIGNIVDGRMYFSSPDMSYSGQQYEEFKSAYEERYNSQPISIFHANAFDASNMILKCIDEVGVLGEGGDLKIGRQDMRTCLYNITNFIGITGRLSCDMYGDCADPRILISVLEQGEYVQIWP